MDNDIYNPFSYDESVILDQLQTCNVEQKIEERYLKEKTSQMHRPQSNQMNRPQTNQPHQPQRETFAVCPGYASGKKWKIEHILILLVVVLAAICIVQYISNNQLNQDINDLIACIYMQMAHQHQHPANQVA